MKKINFIVAIATYNRINYLKKAVDSVLNQKVKNNINLELVLSNSCSSDETYSYIESLRGKKNIHIYNSNDKIPKNNLSQFVNFENLSKTIPEDADWVWWLGDDDKLVGDNSIQVVVDTILKNNSKDLTFIHACSARRYSKTNKQVKNTIFNLCEEFGYHEMLGWCSSIVMRGECIKKTLALSSKNKNYLEEKSQSPVSCFIHSAYILKNYFNKIGVFLDYPLVDNQEFGQSEETIRRWNKENVSNRYFEIVSDLFELSEVLPKKKFKANFFRYHTYFIWDHLAHLCLIKLDFYIKNLEMYKSGKVEIDKDFQLYIESFQDNINKKWQKICQIADLIEDNQTLKLLAFTFLSGINYTNMYLNSSGSKEIKTNYIDAYADIVRKFPIFKFEIGSYKVSNT